MSRIQVPGIEAFLISLTCPPHIQQAVLALRDHIATCGPARWRASGPRPAWTFTASVGGHVICLVNWRPTDSHVHVRVRDTEPGDGRLARIAYVLSPARTSVPVDSVDAAAALFPRLTTAYALASRPRPTSPSP